MLSASQNEASDTAVGNATDFMAIMKQSHKDLEESYGRTTLGGEFDEIKRLKDELKVRSKELELCKKKSEDLEEELAGLYQG